MLQSSATIDFNGTVVIYKKQSQIHTFFLKKIQKLYWLVCHTFPDILAAMTRILCYPEWNSAQTDKNNSQLSKKKKMKGKSGH